MGLRDGVVVASGIGRELGRDPADAAVRGCSRVALAARPQAFLDVNGGESMP